MIPAASFLQVFHVLNSSFPVNKIAITKLLFAVQRTKEI